MKYVIVRKLNGIKLDESPIPMTKIEAMIVLRESHSFKDGFKYELQSVGNLFEESKHSLELKMKAETSKCKECGFRIRGENHINGSHHKLRSIT